MIPVAALLLVSGAADVPATPPETCRIEYATSAKGVLWVLCDYRQILSTKDNGATWQWHRLQENTRFRTTTFLDDRRGFVAGDGGTLLRTVDGGSSWQPVKVPTDENLTSLFFIGDTGWATGWGGVILKTTDAGATWTNLTTGITQSLERIFFATPTHGWAVGWAGTLLRTADGGETWKPLRTGTLVGSLNAVYFRNEKQGWVTAFGGEILTTSDGGETWKAQTALANASLTSIAFDPKGRGWIAAGDRLLYSDDGWATSKSVPLQEVNSLHTVVLFGDSLWAVSQTEIWRNIKGTADWKPVELRKPTAAAKSRS
jgi:photosystem II stability/assembly factor-like uncharacterized protein